MSPAFKPALAAGLFSVTFATSAPRGCSSPNERARSWVTSCKLIPVSYTHLDVYKRQLYKIVPFLAWFHLQAQLFQRVKVPNMKQLLPDACVRQQWWSYLAALLLLLAAAVRPKVFTYPAALAVGVTGGWRPRRCCC